MFAACTNFPGSLWLRLCRAVNGQADFRFGRTFPSAENVRPEYDGWSRAVAKFLE